jgi:predicted RND superfamily exporter protein
VSWTDLPALARRPFTEADGTIGRVMLLYPPERGLSIWDGKALLRIASVIQTVTLPDGRQLETSGSAVVFAAMIRAVIQDGPLVTLASLCAVALLVLLRVRPLGDALRVLLALLVGVCWMVGTAGWLGVRITFLNFIALPFIFGVGVEYAIHVVAEQRQHGRVSRTILSAGGPVALCSWSAIAGYGSLLAARNGALQGLGAVATLGEVTCLVAAVVVLPGAFAWALRSKTD